MEIILNNGIKLFYKKIGRGKPLILLHGNGDSHKDLATLGQALADDYTVYLIDSRGHGNSSNHNEYFVYEDLAEDINLFIKQLDLKEVSMIGHSDGAIIATLLAIAKKTYLSKIILLGVTLKPDQMKSKWSKWIQKEYEKNKHPLFRLMANEPQIDLADLTAIQIPTLVVAAEDDVMATERYVEIAEMIPEGQLHVVMNEDHASYVVGSDKFSEKAKEFLSHN